MKTSHSCYAAVGIRSGAIRKPVFVLVSIQESHWGEESTYR
jgi:hypothetical protein